ncbi:cupin domain-containing protein [Streptomyces netropsis]|uniref:cupin domain-containing protein n=1 Tax=Streptomyces netropsis TaxID=55404 RepID=UPI0037A4FB2A
MIDAPLWAERLGGETFLAQTLSRSHHVSRGPDGAFDSLLSWDALNTILATHRLSPPRLRLSADGDALPPERYAIPVTNRRGSSWHRILPADLHARLAEGASLVLDSAEEIHPPITAAAQSLERFVRTSVQVNAYASWTPTEGFGTHWDDHDVVVAQIDGAKRWRLYGPTRTSPDWRDVEFPPEPTGDPVEEVVLTSGDLLYLPRGCWHAVTADQGAPSLHLSFGLTGPRTGADLLGWLVDQLRTRLTVRQDVPRFARAQDQAAYTEELRKELLAELDRPDLVQRWAASVDTTHPGRPRTSLPYINRVPAEPGVVVRLTCPRAHLDTGADDGTVVLAGAGTAWEFAAAARPVLQALMPGRPVALGYLAEQAALPVADVAQVVAVLVEGQAAAVTGTGQ